MPYFMKKVFRNVKSSIFTNRKKMFSLDLTDARCKSLLKGNYENKVVLYYLLKFLIDVISSWT